MRELIWKHQFMPATTPDLFVAYEVDKDNRVVRVDLSERGHIDSSLFLEFCVRTLEQGEDPITVIDRVSQKTLGPVRIPGLFRIEVTFGDGIVFDVHVVQMPDLTLKAEGQKPNKPELTIAMHLRKQK